MHKLLLQSYPGSTTRTPPRKDFTSNDLTAKMLTLMFTSATGFLTIFFYMFFQAWSAASSLRCTTSTLSRFYPSPFVPRAWDFTVSFNQLPTQFSSKESKSGSRESDTNCVSIFSVRLSTVTAFRTIFENIY